MIILSPLPQNVLKFIMVNMPFYKNEKYTTETTTLHFYCLQYMSTVSINQVAMVCVRKFTYNDESNHQHFWAHDSYFSFKLTKQCEYKFHNNSKF